MSQLLRRPTRLTVCFYCQTSQQPRDSRSFKCNSCACWNRYDKNGEIVSDDPAMHDESLNARSFARRASPRKDRLPTMYSQGQSSGLFCHTCQTNQMLISNLLSNYLPSQDDPEYSLLLAQLPAYQSSLENRYPPICLSCLPAVEEEIKRRDHMARTSALGGFLKESRGKGKQRQIAETYGQKEALERQLVIWRARGVLWVVTLAVCLSIYGAVLAGFTLLRVPHVLINMSPILALSSIIWTAWDPKYAALKRSQLQGRELRQRGKKEYNILQSLAWLLRLLTTSVLVLSLHRPDWDSLGLHLLPPSELQDPLYGPALHNPVFGLSRVQWFCGILFMFELVILTRSLYVLRIDRPPAVRLMPQFSFRPSTSGSTASSSRQSTPSLEVAPPDLFSTLSLSNKPIIPNHVTNGRARSNTPNPIFGRTSFSSGSYTSAPEEKNDEMMAMTMNDMDDDFDGFDEFDEPDDETERDPNAMDWSPITPVNRGSNPNRRRSLQAVANSSSSQQLHQLQHQAKSKSMSRMYDDGAWLRPQRFFVPEEPTGLEGLFEKTITLDDGMLRNIGRESKSEPGPGKSRWVTWVKGRLSQ